MESVKPVLNFFLKSGANVAFTFQSAKDEADKLLSGYSGSSKIKYYQVNLSDTNEIDKVIENVLNDFGIILICL